MCNTYLILDDPPIKQLVSNLSANRFGSGAKSTADQVSLSFTPSTLTPGNIPYRTTCFISTSATSTPDQGENMLIREPFVKPSHGFRFDYNVILEIFFKTYNGLSFYFFFFHSRLPILFITT